MVDHYNMKTATLILTKEEIEQFKVFQKNIVLFNLLLENKVFDMQFGKVILNIAYGELQNIVKEEMVHRKLTK